MNWPHDFDNADWQYGVPQGLLKDFAQTWRHDFDWRAQEAKMNAFAHYRTEVDGLPIHFIHERGRGPKWMNEAI